MEPQVFDLQKFQKDLQQFKTMKEKNPSLSYWDYKKMTGDFVDQVNKSSADFVQRLQQTGRKTIPDWEYPTSVATHKLGWDYDQNGNPTIYPTVQNTIEIPYEDQGLHDFSNPMYRHNNWDAFDSALERGDTVQAPNTDLANWYTENNYKNYYPEFDEGTGEEGVQDDSPGFFGAVGNFFRKGWDRFKTTTAILHNVADAVVRDPIQQIFGNTQDNSSMGRTYNATGARLSRMQADINKQNRQLPTRVGQVKPFQITGKAIKRFNKDVNGSRYALFEPSALVDALTGGLRAWEYNNGQTSGSIMIDPENKDRYIVHITDAYTFDDSNANDAAAAERSPIRKFLGKTGRRDGDPKASKQDFYYYVPRWGNDTVRAHAVFPEDYENGNPSDEDIERMKRLFEEHANKNKHAEGTGQEGVQSGSDRTIWDYLDEYAENVEPHVANVGLVSGVSSFVTPNPVSTGVFLGSNILGAGIDAYQLGRSLYLRDYANATKNAAELGLGLFGLKQLKNGINLRKKASDPGIDWKKLKRKLENYVRTRGGSTVSSISSLFDIGDDSYVDAVSGESVPAYDEGTNSDGIQYRRVPGPWLDEVVVTPNGNYINQPRSQRSEQDAYNSAMLDAWGKQTRMGLNALDYTPVVGDIKGMYDIGKDFYNRDYLSGGIGLATFLLPPILEKPAKRLLRRAYRLFSRKGNDAAEQIIETATPSTIVNNDKLEVRPIEQPISTEPKLSDADIRQREYEDFINSLTFDDRWDLTRHYISDTDYDAMFRSGDLDYGLQRVRNEIRRVNDQINNNRRIISTIEEESSLPITELIDYSHVQNSYNPVRDYMLMPSSEYSREVDRLRNFESQLNQSAREAWDRISLENQRRIHNEHQRRILEIDEEAARRAQERAERRQRVEENLVSERSEEIADAYFSNEGQHNTTPQRQRRNTSQIEESNQTFSDADVDNVPVNAEKPEDSNDSAISHFNTFDPRSSTRYDPENLPEFFNEEKPFLYDRENAAYFKDRFEEEGITALDKAKEDFQNLKHGQAWHLTHDGATSTDSYPLQLALFRRHQKDGKIGIMHNDDGSVKYQILNFHGKTKGEKAINKINYQLEKIGEIIGVPDLKVISRNGALFVPSLFFRKYDEGTDQSGIQDPVSHVRDNVASELTPEQLQALQEQWAKEMSMSGAIRPVFDIRDAVDMTPFGDAATVYDMYNAVRGDQIGTAAMLGASLFVPGLLRKPLTRLGKKAKQALASAFDNEIPNVYHMLLSNERQNVDKHIGESLQRYANYLDDPEVISKVWDSGAAKEYDGAINEYLRKASSISDDRPFGGFEVSFPPTKESWSAAVPNNSLLGDIEAYGPYVGSAASPEISPEVAEVMMHEGSHLLDRSVSRNLVTKYNTALADKGNIKGFRAWFDYGVKHHTLPEHILSSGANYMDLSKEGRKAVRRNAKKYYDYITKPTEIHSYLGEATRRNWSEGKELFPYENFQQLKDAYKHPVAKDILSLYKDKKRLVRNLNKNLWMTLPAAAALRAVNTENDNQD